MVRAEAQWRDRWWEIDLPDIGTRSSARSRRQVQRMAEEAAAVWLEVEPAEIDVRLTFQERVRISFTLTKEQDEALRRLAATEGRSMNAIVVDALEAYVQEHSSAAASA